MVEKEYIEREAAQKVLADDYAYNAAKLLDTVPIADVQEVRHGKNLTKAHPVDEFICSECGYMTEDCTEKNIARTETIVIFANMNISFAPIVEQKWIRSESNDKK